MCVALSCLPEGLDRMDEDKYQLFRTFMRFEQNAGKLRSFQNDFYGK